MTLIDYSCPVNKRPFPCCTYGPDHICDRCTTAPRRYRVSVGSYFDTSLGIEITGPRHKQRVLNDRNLVEVGNEAIPWSKTDSTPILTENEWRNAWTEVLSKSPENGDA